MLHIHPVGDLQQIAVRLRDEFNALPHRCVERCVSDTWKCAEHLGLQVTPGLVEGIAREHLRAMIKSRPPSALAVRPRAYDHERIP
ncbi:MAG: hypothetical protein M0026_11880 [Nocardiopsaceae bacterium]|nr:hypothetical protein [Nocardiopsaceae bacterium]